MIYIGADHGGYQLKEKVKNWLKEWGYQYTDLGADTHKPEDDYVDYAHLVAERVNQESDRDHAWSERTKGILLCRSGGGMLIAANRYPNVYGVYVFDTTSAKHAREDNDANLISLAGDWVDDQTAKQAIKAWLETEFSNEPRHQRRVKKINKSDKDS